MTVVVVGAGLAGLRTVEALRQQGYADAIVLVGAEKHAPYSRPPLSKEVLRGDAEPDTALLRRPDELEGLGVDLRLGRQALALDVAGRQVELDDGAAVAFDDVVIATGATPRRLPGVGTPDVAELRTLDDCLALRDRLVRGARVVVVGAGFIGLEVAASAVARGCVVTVLDVLGAPLSRVLDPQVGAAIQSLHESHGVRFRFDAAVTSVDGATVRLGDGTVLDADVVVVGIGVRPETDWLAGSALQLDDGVVCDAALRAAPHVWAVGDVARWADSAGVATRVEHWTSAAEQAHCVARNIVAGTADPFETVAYFWSDQYDAKLQSLGWTTGDETVLVAGAWDESKWLALVRAGDRLAGVVGLRMPGRVMKLRPLLAAGTSWADALAATA